MVRRLGADLGRRARAPADVSWRQAHDTRFAAPSAAGAFANMASKENKGADCRNGCHKHHETRLSTRQAEPWGIA